MESLYFLAKQAISGLLYAWPVSLVLTLAVVLSMFVAYRHGGGVVRNVGWCLLPIVFPLALLMWGTVFRWSNGDPYPVSTWIEYGLAAIFLLQLPVAVVVVRRARGARMLVSASFLFVGHLSCWAAFTSIMSVTGDWL
jgi:hypothetical protein